MKTNPLLPWKSRERWKESQHLAFWPERHHGLDLTYRIRQREFEYEAQIGAIINPIWLIRLSVMETYAAGKAPIQRETQVRFLEPSNKHTNGGREP